MFKNIAKALGADPQKKELDRLTLGIEKINRLEKPFESLSDQDLRAMTDAFRKRLASGETLDDILPEAFAAVREASKRTTGLRHFDIQLIGGMVLHEGRIAEMRTGEGKTLVATLPLYLNALPGKGTHLVTVNDYLARRDARWMAPIYHMLGFSVGVLQMSERTDNARNAFLVDLDVRSSQEENDQLRTIPRQSAYQADITYGTNNEFGFDYLRDNLVMDIHNRVQRGHHYAIIDEVDNILIDEARTPLIISGPASEDVAWYSRMAAVVRQLEPEDYDFDEKDRSIALTEVGEVHVEELLQIPLRDPDRPEDITSEQARLLGHLEQALKAQLLFKKNKDYILQNGEIVIVDEFTGRLMPGRRWSEGLHQAVEAKEGVKVNPENITHATITLQNYFRKYEKLAGMTGTALTEAEEFSTIYKLDVIVIPTNLDFESNLPESDLVTLQAKDPDGYAYTYYALKKDSQPKPVFWKRKDYPDVVYRSEEAKLRAITLEILNFHLVGRPQLVGTTSIEHSERLSSRLQADMLRRLLMTVLIREKWMEAHNIQSLDRAIPELEQLNQPLDSLNPADLRQFAHTLNMQSVNPDSEENLEVIRQFLGLDETSRGRLENVVQGGIPNQVLNALRHDQESRIIAGAGAFSAVTIATNMAGRGVDIKLGGEIGENILSDIRHFLSESGTDPYGMTNTQLAEALQHLSLDTASGYTESVQNFLSFHEETRRVRELGGLHVIGSERHEARRIDNQLRGRSARQGDPGSSRFYLSLEDELMRMFGGERAETLMRIFNIDASIPLESNMLGRLVEQAQERVEGYNFDIRKHLLDYDDVLNTQRERIYAERDRALTKVNLEEDVLDMLHSEMQRRIQEGMADTEGPWKLLAYLDEVQPTIFYPQQQARVTSYSLNLIVTILESLIKDTSDDNAITAGALELARQALEAERDHIISSTNSFIQRTAASYEQQLAERLDMLDIFFDAMDEQNTATPRELATQLQEQVHLRLQLDADVLSQIRENKRGGKDQVQALVEQGLMQIFLSRLMMAIERRLSEPISIKADQLEGLNWDSIENRVSESILNLFNSRMEKLADLENEILHNIQVILRRQRETNQETLDLYELAAGMSLGTRMAIDARTHQKGFRQVHLLNYTFLAARQLSNKNPAQAADDILNHLDDVQNQLRWIWGNMELARLSENAATVQELPLQYQYNIKQVLGTEKFSAVAAAPLENLKNSGDLNFPDLLGSMVQQAIYKHILLSAISELWIEHLTRMEALRVSIRMEAYAQRDPLVLYKNESTETFKNLLSEIRMGVISRMFRVQPAKPQAAQPDDGVKPQPTKPVESESQEAKKKRKRHKKR